MTETVTHIHQDSKYKVVIERGAVKGVIGYKVEANGDELEGVLLDAQTLKTRAEAMTVNELTERKGE